LNKGSDSQQIAKILLEMRGQEKLLSTYYDGAEKFIYPDGCIRSQYNHAATETSRLSSVKPNMQNVPPIAREHFDSRWGEEGCIVSADFSQLEIVGFAYYTQDPQLIQDLVNGDDIHAITASKVHGETISKDDPRRKEAKAVNYGLIYGQGSWALSQRLDISRDKAEAMIDVFYSRYPRAKMWQDYMLEEAERYKELIDEFTPKGEQKHQYKYRTPVGRTLTFKTTDSPIGKMYYWLIRFMIVLMRMLKKYLLRTIAKC
jgi:DNA polymerase-1